MAQTQTVDAGQQANVDLGLSQFYGSAADAPATQLAYLVDQCTPCVLRPFAFFVSWQGVLTLAYRGFPEPLVALKAGLADYYGGLPEENPGSRWPKTSLGALKDGRRLTPEQLKKLNAVCWECSGVFQTPGAPRQQAVLVDRLSSVIYECRSLERQISKHVMRINGPRGMSRSGSGAASSGGGGLGAGGGNGGGGGGGSRGGGASSSGGGCSVWVDPSEPSPQERARVDTILGEADHPDYWFHASKDGNRESHYRGTALGATLVHELACFSPAGQRGVTSDRNYSTALPDIIRRFRLRVEEAMPGAYAWFEEASLHVTIRALIP